MYFDSISLDGTSVASNVVTSAGPLPAGWAEQAGFMLQLDTNGACGGACTISESVDEAKFSTFQGPLTLANGTSTTASAYNDAQYIWTLEGSATNPTSLTFCTPIATSSVSTPPLSTASTIALYH